MKFLVDTNVISETMKVEPNAKVLQWMKENESKVYLSAVTIGEIRFGIERLPQGRRRDGFESWLGTLGDLMRGRILSYNRATAHVWGQLQAKLEASGQVMPTIDGLIAATAKRNQMVVATRNTKDFEVSGIECVNPFS